MPDPVSGIETFQHEFVFSGVATSLSWEVQDVFLSDSRNTMLDVITLDIFDYFIDETINRFTQV